MGVPETTLESLEYLVPHLCQKEEKKMDESGCNDDSNAGSRGNARRI